LLDVGCSLILFAFFKYLLGSFRCCFTTLLLSVAFCYYACQFVLSPHFLVQVEELGATPTNVIHQ
jgi:hypothetical protein